VLIISSAHVYGEPEYVPIDELHPLNPNSPYAKSRVEQEKLVNDFDLDIIISRSFNHTGPGQQTGFVCPDFINEAKRLLSGEIESIKVGNLEAKRDISDVRDVVNAYKLLLEKGESNSIYNVCSGSAISIQYILDTVLEIAGLDSSNVEIDKEKYRPIDVEKMYGDNSKIKNLGWHPKYRIEKTLEDMWKFINKPH
jgi:GDP-4-dehydro-6-deoxy-D-mannose reductase